MLHPAIPSTAPLADELASLRAEIARLSAREQAVSTAIAALPASPTPMRRPGWPIRRIGDTGVSH